MAASAAARTSAAGVPVEGNVQRLPGSVEPPLAALKVSGSPSYVQVRGDQQLARAAEVRGGGVDAEGGRRLQARRGGAGRGWTGVIRSSPCHGALDRERGLGTQPQRVGETDEGVRVRRRGRERACGLAVERGRLHERLQAHVEQQPTERARVCQHVGRCAPVALEDTTRADAVAANAWSTVRR